MTPLAITLAICATVAFLGVLVYRAHARRLAHEAGKRGAVLDTMLSEHGVMRTHHDHMDRRIVKLSADVEELRLAFGVRSTR
jgi:hypothetical protein